MAQLEYWERAREVRRTRKSIHAGTPYSLTVVKSFLDGLRSGGSQGSGNMDGWGGVDGGVGGLGGEGGGGEMAEEEASVKIQRAFREAYGLTYVDRDNQELSSSMGGQSDRMAEFNLRNSDRGGGLEKESLIISTKESGGVAQMGTPSKGKGDQSITTTRGGNLGSSKTSSMLKSTKKFVAFFSPDNGDDGGGKRKSKRQKSSKEKKGNPISFHSNARKSIRTTPEGDEYKKKASQLGSKMMKVTGERVAMGIILILVVSVIFTYFEKDNSHPQTMITLHTIELSSLDSTTNQSHIDRALTTILTSTPSLYVYRPLNKTDLYNPVLSATQRQHTLENFIRRERSNITICTANDCSTGLFDIRDDAVQTAWASFLLNFFIMLVWCMSVLSYALPVSALIVIPIERMVRFLGMLVKDPLGYQKTKTFYQFVEEEAGTLKKTGWRKEVVDGMET